MRRIGVIAGVFDPFHLGHKQFILNAIEQNNLDRVLILLEEKSKYKMPLASAMQRKKIIELSIKDQKNISIHESKSKSFPISSTLPQIKAQNLDAKIYLLVGEDVVSHIKSWPDSENLLKNVKLITAKRNINETYGGVSSQKVKNDLRNNPDNAQIAPEALEYCLKEKIYI